MNNTGICLLVCLYCIAVGTGTLIQSPFTKSMFFYEDDDYTIVEGDMVVPKFVGRNALSDPRKLWPYNTIPYKIIGNFTAEEMDNLYSAIESFQDTSCVQLVPWTVYHRDYIAIDNSNNGCYSHVGYLGKGAQVINLGRGCLYEVATPIHEILHACGMDHEHNRDDRDEWINILWQNIKRDQQHNFEKVGTDEFSSYGVPYNYDSVMHYDPTAFVIQKGLKSFEVLQSYGGEFGSNVGWADTDIEKLNLMYEC